MQREVAERITAKPGNLSLLALTVQVYGAPSLAGRIPAGAFYPPPKVDSAVVRVDLYKEPLIPVDQIEVFFRLAKAGFSQKTQNPAQLPGRWPGADPRAIRRTANAGRHRPHAPRADPLLDEWRELVTVYPNR